MKKRTTPGKKTVQSAVNSTTYYSREELKHIRESSSYTPDAPAASHPQTTSTTTSTVHTAAHGSSSAPQTTSTRIHPDETHINSTTEQDAPAAPAGSRFQITSTTSSTAHMAVHTSSSAPQRSTCIHPDKICINSATEQDAPDAALAGSHPQITSTSSSTAHTAVHGSSSAPQRTIHPGKSHINNTTKQDALLSPLHRKRGKVREQAERVNNMIKSTTHQAADECKMLKAQVQYLSSALKEMEHAVSRVQVVRHKKKIPENEIDYQTESEKCQKQLQAQTERMEVLECERRAKADEVDNLRVELEDRLRVIVEYEIDLESHNIHYTSYAEERQQLEEDALNELYDEDISEDKMEIIDALAQKYGCRIQQLISMLLTDYADIEARYKRDQLANTKGMVQLQSQTQELKATVAVLEEQLKEKELKYPVTLSSSFLVQRIHQLEREKRIVQESNQELKEKVRQADESKEPVLQEKQQEIERLTLEKNSADMLALALQDQRYREKSRNTAASSAVHLKLTERIQEQNKDMVRLQKELQGKNERIAVLRSEAINYQIRSFPIYCEDIGSFSKAADDDRSGATADNSDLGLSQDAQFQDMQHLLCKKEEEFSKERKRFAAREIELMALVRESHPEISTGAADLRFSL